mmetsp:Transcript_32850/g.45619  ORF Transcript_32850/g.45619 Transcript_32850/m.45619 type:complete len:235 (+) Transcript_32850:66-770(+)|eukprot:CAMPEP_0196581956 /NCGR_PEP_ID=MMETSP1081-20130531/36662_1 /TAXON_ID=36882 /ORGANISM="Pyramimonas amylifera, Strain CCMP720" /LENGTH=234 /DNA_ID=CAMNT_0041902379 /DNA_START=66 /DNA_END=770 /DNA_ORIENTATION=+
MSKTEIIQQNEIFLTAVISGNEKKVEEMLEHGAMVNAFNQYGATPLHWAASEDHVEVVKVLLRYGANPNAKACDGCTPLHFACREDSFKSASVLLECGANVTSRTNQGSCALDLVYDEDECPDFVKLLKEYMEKVTTDNRLQFKTLKQPESDEDHTGPADASTSPIRGSFSGGDDLSQGMDMLAFSDEADGCMMFGYDGDDAANDIDTTNIENGPVETYDRVVRPDGRIEMAIG